MKMTRRIGALIAVFCLMMSVLTASAETRRGVIMLEGIEEEIEETLFESPSGFSFWYANEKLNAYEGEADGIAGVVVAALYSDDRMVLSLITEDEALKMDRNIAEESLETRVQKEISVDTRNGVCRFVTLIAENGRYLRASGRYFREAAEGNARYFSRVLDSVTILSEYDAEFLRELPGTWSEDVEGWEQVLTLGETGEMSLRFGAADGSFACSYAGSWSYRSVAGQTGRLTLRFTSTDHPSRAGGECDVECEYDAYTESWVENDTLITFLILNPMISSTGVSPFEEVCGDENAALHRDRGPNMKVVNCREFVSLREERSTSARRVVKVPLGALVLAFPEYGDQNGFIYCVYQGEEGYILAEYLQPVR